MIAEKIIAKMDEIEAIQQEMKSLQKQAFEIWDAASTESKIENVYNNYRPLVSQESNLLLKVNPLIQEVGRLITQTRQEKNNWLKAVDDAKKEQAKRSALENAAGKGDANAQYDLSRHYLAEKNTLKATELLAKAAKAGHMNAQYSLATLLKASGGSEEMISKLIKSASDQGHEHAMIEFAIMQEDEPRIAFTYFSKAYEKYKNPLAMIHMGIAYCDGNGISINPTKGKNFVLEGLRLYNGTLDTELYRELGDLFLGKTTEDGSQDLENAVKLFEKGRVLGDDEFDVFLKEIKDAYVRDTLEQKRDALQKEWNVAKDSKETLYNILHEQIAAVNDEAKRQWQEAYDIWYPVYGGRDRRTVDHAQEASDWVREHRKPYIDSERALYDDARAKVENIESEIKKINKQLEDLDKPSVSAPVQAQRLGLPPTNV